MKDLEKTGVQETAEQVADQLSNEIEGLTGYDFNTYSNNEKYINIQLADMKIGELRRLRGIAVARFRVESGNENIKECEECHALDEEIRELMDIRRKFIMSTQF